MKLMLRVTTFAVAITIMLLIALAMNVASAGPPEKVKLNPDQTKEELNLSEEHIVVSNPSETISSPSSVTRSSWSIETVDSDIYILGWYTSLALDSNGYPHISYLYTSWGHLKYAKWTGSEWDIETVDSDGTVGYYTSLALDTNDYPHISYYNRSNENLKYAKWTGSEWDIETVDPTRYVGKYTSLALDTSDYPHISYFHDIHGELMYAKWTGSEWDIEIVDSNGFVGEYTSLALDTNDYPHISYYDYINQSLKYAKWTGSVWSIETVDSSGRYAYTSIALDSNNYPHISYYGYYDLKYAKWTGSEWNIELLDPDGLSYYYTSIALDTNDYPHISYHCSSPTPYDDLKYAKWTGSIWSLQVVDSLGDVGEFSSIALDTNDCPHISYYDRSYEALKYAYYISDIVTQPEIISYAPESPVNDYIGANRTFSITINQTVNVNWQINGTGVQANASVTAASYTNTSAVNGTWNVSAIVANANGTDMQTWDWTVTSPCFTPPEIISYAPESPVNDYIGANRTFEITINQTVNVSWQINGTEVQTNASVTAASYTNTGAANGTWNVSAIVTNVNGSDMQTWTWTVTTPCFIATAAYGTALHDDINVLRDFRDEYLIPNPAGRAFVNIYYSSSPPLADLIRGNAGLRTAVREGLVKPLVEVTRRLVE